MQEQRPAKRLALTNPQSHLPIIADVEHKIDEEKEQTAKAQAEILKREEHIAKAKLSLEKYKRKVTEAEEYIQVEEQKAKAAHALFRKSLVQLDQSQNTLKFLKNSLPGKNQNPKQWRIEAQEAIGYCGSKFAFFKDHGEQAVTDLVLRGHAILTNKEAKEEALPTWFPKLYEHPAILELIGAGRFQINDQLLSISQDFHDCLFNTNVLQALSEELVTSDQIATVLNRYNTENDIFKRIELSITFTNLFDKGLSLLRSKALNIDRYFSQSKPEEHLDHLLRLATEARNKPVPSYEPNLPPTILTPSPSI